MVDFTILDLQPCFAVCPDLGYRESAPAGRPLGGRGHCYAHPRYGI